MFKKYSAYVAAVVLCALFFPLCTGVNRATGIENGTCAGNRLPQQFTGTFRWEGIDETQRVIINIYSVRSVSGVITATGKGTYNTAGAMNGEGCGEQS